jgi:hypothetical protein
LHRLDLLYRRTCLLPMAIGGLRSTLPCPNTGSDPDFGEAAIESRVVGQFANIRDRLRTDSVLTGIPGFRRVLIPDD